MGREKHREWQKVRRINFNLNKVDKRQNLPILFGPATRTPYLPYNVSRDMKLMKLIKKFNSTEDSANCFKERRNTTVSQRDEFAPNRENSFANELPTFQLEASLPCP